MQLPAEQQTPGLALSPGPQPLSRGVTFRQFSQKPRVLWSTQKTEMVYSYFLSVFILFLHRVDMFLLCAGSRREIGIEYFALFFLVEGGTVTISQAYGKKMIKGAGVVRRCCRKCGWAHPGPPCPKTHLLSQLLFGAQCLQLQRLPRASQSCWQQSQEGSSPSSFQGLFPGLS